MLSKYDYSFTMKKTKITGGALWEYFKLFSSDRRVGSGWICSGHSGFASAGKTVGSKRFLMTDLRPDRYFAQSGL